jgi:GNAT superfamily N-acetyltransferase
MSRTLRALSCPDPNWGFVPLAEAEIAHVAASLRPLIEEELVWFAEVDGAPAAMAVLLPNLNEVIADLGGRLLPFGWAKLLWRLKARRPATARVPLMGVRKAHNGSALGGALALAVIDAARRGALRAGIRHVEMSWVLEDNLAMRRIIDRIGGRRHKTYRVYEKALA